MGLDERALAGLAKRIHSGDLTGPVAFDAVVAMVAADEIPRDCLPAEAAQIRDEVVLGLSHDRALCELLYGAPSTAAQRARSRLAPPRVAGTRPGGESTREDEEVPVLSEDTSRAAGRPEAPSAVPASQPRKAEPNEQRKPAKPAKPAKPEKEIPKKPRGHRAKPAREADALEDAEFAGARRRSQLLGAAGFMGVVAAGVAFWYFTRTTTCERLVKQLCLEGSTVTCEAKNFENALKTNGVDDAKCGDAIAAIETDTQGVGNEARGRVVAASLQTVLGFDPRGDAAPKVAEPEEEKGPPTPVALIGDQGTISSLFVDGSHVYWTRSNPPASVRVRNIGGTAEVLGAHADPIDIKASRDYVYWLSRAPERGTVWVDPKRGVHDPSTLPTPEFNPVRAAFIGAEFGFIDATGAVAVAAVAGGPARKLAEPSIPAPTTIAGDRTMIYFGIPAPIAAIHAAPRDGSRPAIPLATGIANAVALRVHSGHLYWIDGSNGTISRVPVAGGPATALAQGQVGAGALAFDDERLYWANATAGTVSAAPLGGGEIQQIVGGIAGVNNVAVDGAAIYWDARGTVFRLPK